LGSAQDASKPVKITFTTINVPGAGYTGVSGINTAGNMVGTYGQNVNTDSNGFLYSNGVFSYFDYPGATITVPYKINDSGLIVGSTGYDPVFGFLYDGSTFTTIVDGSDTATYTLGINNAGLIVGAAGSLGVTRGFELRGQKFKAISPPPGGWIYVDATDINTFGVIVGWTEGNPNGFLDKGGKFQTINYPGSTQTEVWGINDSGTAVGWYESCTPACGIHGFAVRAGKYLSIDYPNAIYTAAFGINAAGQVVGGYELAENAYQGFVTSPITPADFERPGCCVIAADESER
jgi:probable HAF family extracellular repeat protein